MANALYDKAREGYLDATFDWGTSDQRLALISATYTANLATDTVMTPVTSSVLDATWRSTALTGKSVANGVADHAPKTLTAAANVSSTAATRIIYYEERSGTDATRALVCLIDTATGLPVTPNGGDITVTADVGANKLFKL